MIEYKTTSARHNEAGGNGSMRYTETIPDPVAPEGKGWRMVGATASPERLFWFWMRQETPITYDVTLLDRHAAP